MLVPIYFVFIIGAAALLAAVIASYLRIYKRRINRALHANQGQGSAMAPPYQVAAVLTAAVLVVGIIVSYFIGYLTAYRRFDDDAWTLAPTDIQCFYGEVQAVGEESLTVEGNALNEEKFRGEFHYYVWTEYSILWKDAAISLSDLEVGDLVSITLITDRTGTTNLFKIQLLDDAL